MGYLATAGLLDITQSFTAELIAFVIMVLILAKWAWPWFVRATTARQEKIAAQLAAAERAQQEAEQRLQEVDRRLQEARAQAAEMLAAAGRSGEQLRAELRARAEEDAKRVVESARQDIEAERRRAIDSIRSEVADMVVSATEKVIGEALDERLHRRLIERALAQMGQAEADGRGRG
jgi:F-type H+-transporting ATPase subunit b